MCIERPQVAPVYAGKGENPRKTCIENAKTVQIYAEWLEINKKMIFGEEND